MFIAKFCLSDNDLAHGVSISMQFFFNFRNPYREIESCFEKITTRIFVWGKKGITTINKSMIYSSLCMSAEGYKKVVQ